MKNAGTYSSEEAQGLLTLGEANAIQRHFNREIGQGLYGLELTSGLIWAIARRGDLAENEKLTSWADVDAMTLTEVGAYFLPDEVDIDPSAPESDSGKEVSPAA